VAETALRALCHLARIPIPGDLPVDDIPGAAAQEALQRVPSLSHAQQKALVAQVAPLEEAEEPYREIAQRFRAITLMQSALTTLRDAATRL
jgi:hypothetical protein